MTSPTTPRPGLRAVTRRAVQAEISNTAMRLFTEHGFEQTTVDQIAAEVGMSTRSIFRYFDTKEDIVLGSMAQIGHDIAAALEQRPADEPAWEALRRSLDGPLQALKEDGGVALARTTLLATNPALRAAQSQKHAQWNELLVPGIAGRLSGSGATRRLQAQAIAAAALACLDVAVEEWTRAAGKKPLDVLLDTAIAAVRN
jgi:AcrR family transcriptional regulator